MMTSDIARMALQAVGKNKIRTFLTTLGIVIGVGAVIAMVSLGQGAQSLVQQQMQSMGTNVLFVMPAAQRAFGGVRGPTDQGVSLTDADAEAIEREVPGLAAVSPVVSTSAQIVAGNLNWSSRIEGGNAQYLGVRDWNVEEGEFFTDADVRGAARVVVLGRTVIANLFPYSDPVGQTVRIRNMPYRVAGVLSAKGQSGMGTDQDDIILMPYTTVQKKVLGSPFPTVNRVSVSATSPDMATVAADQITQLLRARHNIRPGETDDFRVNNMTEIAEAAEQTTRIMTLLLGSVAAVSLIVGGIGIMNIMLVSVTERTREIGIRMAIGSRGSYIRLQFLTESVFLCMLGGLVGILAGIALSIGAAKVLGWPTLISPAAVAIAFAFAAGTGIFFGYYPARKAASLEPIDALRYE